MGEFHCSCNPSILPNLLTSEMSADVFQSQNDWWLYVYNFGGLEVLYFMFSPEFLAEVQNPSLLDARFEEFMIPSL